MENAAGCSVSGNCLSGCLWNRDRPDIPVRKDRSLLALGIRRSRTKGPCTRFLQLPHEAHCVHEVRDAFNELKKVYRNFCGQILRQRPHQLDRIPAIANRPAVRECCSLRPFTFDPHTGHISNYLHLALTTRVNKSQSSSQVSVRCEQNRGVQSSHPGSTLRSARGH